MKEAELILATGKWVTSGQARSVSLAPTVDEASALGRRLLTDLSHGQIPHLVLVDSIYAALEVLRSDEVPFSSRFQVAGGLYDFIGGVDLEFDDEKLELQIESSFECWNLARQAGAWSEQKRWHSLLMNLAEGMSPEMVRTRAVCQEPADESVLEVVLHSPAEMLICCGILRSQINFSPREAHDRTRWIYEALQASSSRIRTDLRAYFIGEFALLTGAACRHLALFEEASLWFDRAEDGYSRTISARSDLRRLEYQRLALRLAKREIDAVLELVPALIESMQQLGMRDDELKARFLEGLVLMETDRLREAVDLFQDVCRVGAELRSERLVAEGYINLTHLYGMIGDSSNAIACSQKAIPQLNRLKDRVGLAKVQWGLATLLRRQGLLEESIETYGAAQSTFEELGMRADVAALHLVIADLHLERDREDDALRSVLAALPVIDELRMIPEGMAAMALLRESARQRRINRKALRDIRGYFSSS